MNRHTGRTLTEREHIRQSIADILTTPLGSRIMRRDYGSQLPFLIDQPFNPRTRMLCYAAIVAALMRWEPRIYISRVQLTLESMQGRAVLDLDARLVDLNQPLNLRVPLALGAIA